MSNELSGEKKIKKSLVLDHVFCQFQFTGEGNCTVLCLLPHSSAVYALLYMHCCIWLWQITLMVDYIWECMGMVDLKEQHIQSRQELFL